MITKQENYPTLTQEEISHMPRIVEAGLFDEIAGICEVEQDGISLSNPFGTSEGDFQAFKASKESGDLPKWIKDAMTIGEFYATLEKLYGFTNFLKEKGKTRDFLVCYEDMKSAMAQKALK